MTTSMLYIGRIRRTIGHWVKQLTLLAVNRMYRSTRQDISHSYLVMVATILSLLLYATRFVCVNLLGSAHDSVG